jgi:hypothetical protein
MVSFKISYYRIISLEDLKKTTENLSQYSRSNPKLPAYKTNHSTATISKEVGCVGIYSKLNQRQKQFVPGLKSNQQKPKLLFL